MEQTQNCTECHQPLYKFANLARRAGETICNNSECSRHGLAGPGKPLYVANSNDPDAIEFTFEVTRNPATLPTAVRATKEEVFVTVSCKRFGHYRQLGVLRMYADEMTALEDSVRPGPETNGFPSFVFDHV